MTGKSGRGTSKLGVFGGVAMVALVASSQGAFAQQTSAQSPVEAKQDGATVTVNNDQPPPSSATPSNADLAARVQALEDQLKADRTRLSTVEQNAADTSWTFDNLRPTVKSGDGRFTMALRVRAQTDFAYFDQDPTATTQFKDLSNGAVVRRAFIGVEGKAFNDFWYEFRLNAGGSNGGLSSAGSSAGAAASTEGDPSLSLARVSYIGIPNFRINVGVIEPAFMFEGVTSSGQLLFMERPEIDNIAADAFGAGDARRGVEVSFQKENALWGGDNLLITGALTGNKTGSSVGHGNGADEQSQILGRISERIWSDGISNIQVGMSGAKIINSGDGTGGRTINLQDRPEIRVDGTRLISTGGMSAKKGDMYAFDAGANFQNFYLGAEYAHFKVDRLATFNDSPDFDGFYVEGSWVITGENKTYSASAQNNEIGGFGAPVPSRPFSLAGNSWGAWELALRYSDTDLNYNTNLTTAAGGIFGGEEKVTAVGLNWFLNRAIKVQFNYDNVKVDKLANLGGAQIGQNMNVFGIRVQLSN